MKRDLDLIRQLLFVIEQSETGSFHHAHGLSPNDHRVQYHLRLLVDAGLVRAVGLTGEGSISVRLTWDGHELLELVRNDHLWDRAKRLVHEKTGGSCVEAIRSLLRKWTEMSVADEDRWPVRIPQTSHANGNGNGNGSRLPLSRKPIDEVVRTNSPNLNRSTVPADPDDTTFQFSIWTGHDAERRPLYLL